MHFRKCIDGAQTTNVKIYLTKKQKQKPTTNQNKQKPTDQPKEWLPKFNGNESELFP